VSSTEWPHTDLRQEEIVKRRTCNGWTFWKYKDKKGQLVALAKLRK